MSWLKRLLTGSPTSKPLPSEIRVTVSSHSSRIASVPELDMTGHRAASPNGRYTLIWQDRNWNANASDPRGRYVLIDGECMVIDGRMDRPHDGKLADDGTFILNDWGPSDELAGTFTAFRPDGSQIISRSYAANLLNNGLSHDGRLAACQTCNAPGSPDSSILTVFDLTSGTVFAAWTAESGWANSYEFPSGGNRIRMVRGDKISLDYSLDGMFLDRRKWLQDEVRRGTLYVIRKAMAEDEAATGLSPDELREGVNIAIAESDPRFRADAWRLLGELEESRGNVAAAVEAYEQAVKANPKVGVAKRVATLKRSLPAS